MKHIFITGISSGIGQATANYFLEQGWQVSGFDKSASTVTNTMHYQGNVSDHEAINAAVAKAVKATGPLHAVFANAGIYQRANLLETSAEDWQALIDTNLTGIFNTCKATLPYLLEQQGGTIIINGSDQNIQVKNDNAAYAASKAGLVGLMHSIAADYGAQNIQCHLLAPNTCRTPMIETLVQEWAAKEHDGNEDHLWELFASEQASGKLITPSLIASKVYELCLRDQALENAQIIPIP